MSSSKLDTLLERAKSRRRRNNVVSMEIKLIAGNANKALAEEIAGRLGVPITKSKISRFTDGEISLQVFLGASIEASLSAVLHLADR